MSPDLPSPWAEFLEELDNLLDEAFELGCIGGFAAVAGYGLLRSTNGLDCCSVIPHSRVNDLDRLAGPSSVLARKHKVHLHYAAVASIPESYDERMTEILPGRFKNIRLLIPDPYDLVLSKLTRNAERDREDVAYLAKTRHLDPEILRERYTNELRPILIGDLKTHDQTLEFWIEAYFGRRSS
jgi:hypothetical protein